VDKEGEFVNCINCSQQRFCQVDSLKPSGIPKASVDSVHKDSGDDGAPKRLPGGVHKVSLDDDSISLYLTTPLLSPLLTENPLLSSSSGI